MGHRVRSSRHVDNDLGYGAPDRQRDEDNMPIYIYIYIYIYILLGLISNEFDTVSDDVHAIPGVVRYNGSVVFIIFFRIIRSNTKYDTKS